MGKQRGQVRGRYVVVNYRLLAMRTMSITRLRIVVVLTLATAFCATLAVMRSEFTVADTTRHVLVIGCVQCRPVRDYRAAARAVNTHHHHGQRGQSGEDALYDFRHRLQAYASPSSSVKAGTPRKNPGFSGASRSVRFIAKQSDDPDGIRTRVAALKGPCPRPLDDGAGQFRR